ncbi:branched-chain amino acid transport system ATP-binding protein [Limimaricola variabilis]|uniref:Branched-chain amino acid transport system ATP-binding protein n=1 Tax=Limimaricola variabilis TaxID=1492771 RepID=A0ABR6HQ13_9RHOB|nr:ABC transporter ATP-binding protein [Limimaricola variabilis]MBB3712454.1 branched-chain amino acid transport system ATP-binding protein [Limimaricola variabilis]
MSLEIDGIGIAFGGIKAVDGVSFTAKPGEVTSIIGPNGAGKTTLFNLVSGVYRASSGTVRIDGRDVTGLPAHELARCGMARTFQNLQVFPQMTALDNVMTGCHMQEKSNLLADLLGLGPARRATARSRDAAMAALARAGLADLAHRPASEMSYGQLKRLEIARALVTGCTILLLDEPAAGCNAVETREVDDLIHAIAEEGKTVVLIEHDMRMVMRISSHIVVLDQGRKIAEGGPEEIRTNSQVIAAYLGVHGAAEAEAAAHG